MYKKSMGVVLPAALGLMMGSAAATANASENFNWYVPLQPKQGVVTISMSGECKGKVTLDLITLGVSAGFGVDELGNVLPNYGFSAHVATEGNEFYFDTGSGSNSLGEKLMQSVNGSKVKQSLQMTTRNYLGVGLSVLKQDRFEDVLRCKNGQSFRDSVYASDLAMGSSSFSHKSTFQFTFDNSAPELRANAVLKQQISGNLLAYHGMCSNKGSVNSTKYAVTCEPLKPVRVKIAASAKGTAYPGL